MSISTWFSPRAVECVYIMSTSGHDHGMYMHERNEKHTIYSQGLQARSDVDEADLHVHICMYIHTCMCTHVYILAYSMPRVSLASQASYRLRCDPASF